MTNPREFETLLEYLSRSRGFDFRVYKRPALERRFEKRLEAVHVTSFGDYMDYLEVHPEEFAELFNTILINVTSFFRDGPSWTFLREEVIPRIVGDAHSMKPIRVWSAGCASGEETYSLAIVLAEALGAEAFASRVKIYASDIDAEALAEARSGSYDSSKVEAVPEELREKYFEQQRGRWVFRPDLRRSVIFGRHNIVSDAPISKLDLLVCRNTLMYFNAESQSQILNRFHFALNEDGYLFLGRAEMLVAHAGLFTPLNLRHRVFSRAMRNAPRDRILSLSYTDRGRSHAVAASISPELLDATVEHAGSAMIVVDVHGSLLLANQRARSLFGFLPRELGKLFFDLPMPQLPVDLRPLIQSAYADGHPVTVTGVERRGPDEEARNLRVTVHPVRQEDGQSIGVIITFDDLTGLHRLQVELERTESQLEAVNEELQSTSGELETTNEELQSSNEELETTNEELQSANEELETMNEELQSTNQELQTINEELRQRSDEANRGTLFLESILSGIRAGVIVVDGKLNVTVWSPKAEDLWGVRAAEASGQSIFNLDIGLPMEQFRTALRAALNDGTPQTLEVDARNRRGRAIRCRVSISALADGKKSEGAIVLMEEWTDGNQDGQSREARVDGKRGIQQRN